VGGGGGGGPDRIIGVRELGFCEFANRKSIRGRIYYGL